MSIKNIQKRLHEKRIVLAGLEAYLKTLRREIKTLEGECDANGGGGNWDYNLDVCTIEAKTDNDDNSDAVILSLP